MGFSSPKFRKLVLLPKLRPLASFKVLESIPSGQLIASLEGCRASAGPVSCLLALGRCLG